jgi:DNA repair protein RecO (recombination protein O)
LLAFQPIAIGFAGAHELRTLTAAQWLGGMANLQGEALLCGFYLNELLVRLLPRDDPAPAVFDAYARALLALGEGTAREAALRRFECVLLRELGYGMDLVQDAQAQPITPGRYYSPVPGRGFVLTDGDDPQAVSGLTLLHLAQDALESERTLLEAKRLNRTLLHAQLSGQALKTRQILMDLQKL